MWLLLSSSGVLVGCSIVVVCWVLSSYGEGLFSCNIFSESSLIAVFRGLLSFLVGGSHLYLSESDFSLGMVSGSILSHCGRWLFSSSGRVLPLSCGSGLCAPLYLQWSLLLGCDGGLFRGSLSFWH